MVSIPPPLYFGSTIIPKNPSSPSCLTSSVGKSCFSSRSITPGLRTFCAKSLAASLTAICSSVNSIFIPLFYFSLFYKNKLIKTLNKLKMNYNVLGIMSGTSLDGIDLCLVNFQYKSRWKYKILRAKTIKYSEKWIKDLRLADTLSGRDLSRLDAKYGQFIGQTAANFIKETNEKVDLIASHGHTVFHEPQYHYSKQIGHGAYIAAESGLLTVSDFRSLDLAYGGQGAPLVP